MTKSELLNEFATYLFSEDFRKGIYVEVGGMLIDVILLSLLVPAIIWIMNIRKTHHGKVMATFYTLQLQQKVAKLLLKMGGVHDISSALNAAFEERKIDQLFSHNFYGNTENLHELLKLRIDNGEHISGHQALEASELEKLISDCDDIIADIDRYIFLFNSVGIVEFSKKLFEARMLLYPLRDYIAEVSKTDKQLRDMNTDFRPLSEACLKYFETWFNTEKKLPDRMLKWKFMLQLCGMFVSMPYMLLYRLFAPLVCRFRKKMYLDPWGSNFSPLMINPLLLNCPFSDAELEKGTGTASSKLTEYKMGYNRPTEEELERILNFFMRRTEPERWNMLVLAVLEEDVRRQKPTIVTVEAVKANAVHKFCTYIRKTDGNEDHFWKYFMRFFQLKPF